MAKHEVTLHLFVVMTDEELIKWHEDLRDAKSSDEMFGPKTMEDSYLEKVILGHTRYRLDSMGDSSDGGRQKFNINFRLLNGE
jgi:hypothetical protein